MFKMHPHRYANGVRYRPNLHLIVDADDPMCRPIGGLIELNGKCLAFALQAGGAGSLVEAKIPQILRKADAVAWGATKREAAMNIRPHLRSREA